jgi:hypothetical protein
LKVTSVPDGSYLQLANNHTEPMRHLYVLHVQKGTAKYQHIDQLAAGENRRVNLELNHLRVPLSDAQAEIATAMKGSLESEGLYAAEAGAMVKTWRASWFGEEGLRVLYILPRTWTDRTLPLTIQPQPQEITRVMVGRAEVIAPEVEWKILKEIVRYSEADEAGRAKAVAEVKNLRIGRFVDAIVRRALGKTASVEFSQAAWALFNRVNAQEPAKALVQN